MLYRYMSLNDGDTSWEMSLGGPVIVQTCTYTNLNSIMYLVLLIFSQHNKYNK
jgi:hypothetical protein